MEFNGGTCFHLAASVPREHTLELNVPKITQLQSQLQFSIIEQFEEKKWESGTLLEPNSMSLSASFSPCTPIGFAATSLLSLSSGPKSVCKRKLVFANDKNKNSFVCPPQDFILNLMSLNQTEAFVALGLLLINDDVAQRFLTIELLFGTNVGLRECNFYRRSAIVGIRSIDDIISKQEVPTDIPQAFNFSKTMVRGMHFQALVFGKERESLYYLEDSDTYVVIFMQVPNAEIMGHYSNFAKNVIFFNTDDLSKETIYYDNRQISLDLAFQLFVALVAVHELKKQDELPSFARMQDLLDNLLYANRLESMLFSLVQRYDNFKTIPYVFDRFAQLVCCLGKCKEFSDKKILTYICKLFHVNKNAIEVYRKEKIDRFFSMRSFGDRSRTNESKAIKMQFTNNKKSTKEERPLKRCKSDEPNGEAFMLGLIAKQVVENETMLMAMANVMEQLVSIPGGLTITEKFVAEQVSVVDIAEYVPAAVVTTFEEVASVVEMSAAVVAITEELAAVVIAEVFAVVNTANKVSVAAEEIQATPVFVAAEEVQASAFIALEEIQATPVFIAVEEIQATPVFIAAEEVQVNPVFIADEEVNATVADANEVEAVEGKQTVVPKTNFFIGYREEKNLSKFCNQVRYCQIENVASKSLEDIIEKELTSELLGPGKKPTILVSLSDLSIDDQFRLGAEMCVIRMKLEDMVSIEHVRKHFGLKMKIEDQVLLQSVNLNICVTHHCAFPKKKHTYLWEDLLWNTFALQVHNVASFGDRFIEEKGDMVYACLNAHCNYAPKKFICYQMKRTDILSLVKTYQKCYLHGDFALLWKNLVIKAAFYKGHKLSLKHFFKSITQQEISFFEKHHSGYFFSLESSAKDFSFSAVTPKLQLPFECAFFETFFTQNIANLSSLVYDIHWTHNGTNGICYPDISPELVAHLIKEKTHDCNCPAKCPFNSLPCCFVDPRAPHYGENSTINLTNVSTHFKDYFFKDCLFLQQTCLAFFNDRLLRGFTTIIQMLGPVQRQQTAAIQVEIEEEHLHLALLLLSLKSLISKTYCRISVRSSSWFAKELPGSYDEKEVAEVILTKQIRASKSNKHYDPIVGQFATDFPLCFAYYKQKMYNLLDLALVGPYCFHDEATPDVIITVVASPIHE